MLSEVSLWGLVSQVEDAFSEGWVVYCLQERGSMGYIRRRVGEDIKEDGLRIVVYGGKDDSGC